MADEAPLPSAAGVTPRSAVGAGTAPGAFFAAASEAVGLAERAVGVVESCYTIGGRAVSLRFVGPALLPRIASALEHLQVAEGAGAAELTVHLLDSASTGTRIVDLPWTGEDYLARGEVRGYNDARFRAVFQVDAGVLSLLDGEAGRAIYWCRDAAALPTYENGSPLLTILHWWLGRQGDQLVHAAAVGTAAGGVLLVGRGGSGKSTATLACLCSELRYVGDDFCLLAPTPTPYVHSLYSTGKLHADSLRLLPHLAPLAANPDRPSGEKALFFLRRHFPERIVAGFPVRAVLLPQVTGRVETAVVAASAATGLQALAPSTIYQLPGAGRAAFAAMVALVRQVPCYTLAVGTDLAQVPPTIARLLR